MISSTSYDSHSLLVGGMVAHSITLSSLESDSSAWVRIDVFSQFKFQEWLAGGGGAVTEIFQELGWGCSGVGEILWEAQQSGANRKLSFS